MPASTFSTSRPKGGDYVLTTEAVTALAALTEANTVRDALTILSTVTHDQHAVTPNSFGKASSTLS